jgi:hypothetical protein
MLRISRLLRDCFTGQKHGAGVCVLNGANKPTANDSIFIGQTVYFELFFRQACIYADGEHALLLLFVA